MNTRRLIYLVTGIIVFATIIFLSLNRSPFGKKNTALAVPGGKEVSRIELSDGDKKISLTRDKETWLLNGSADTRKNSISFLIRVLKEMTIKSPVSTDMFEKEIQSGNVRPVRVKAFENHRLITDFLVYKTQTNIYGNIMRKNNHAKPFIFYVPGHDSDIGSVFTLNEHYWQPYTIFNFMPSEIMSVHFENLTDTSDSFLITRNSGKIILTDGRNRITSDSSRVSRYLSYFTFVPFEAWALEMKEEEKTGIIGKQPLYRIEVEGAQGKETKLILWARANEKGEPDSDRLYGRTGDSDEIFVVRYFDIDPILKKRDYFLGN